MTVRVMSRSPICREPHALAATLDGRWLYVPCRDSRYWVVDGHTGTAIKQIETGGRPHNTQVSSDGRWAFLSPMGGTHDAFVVDIAADHQVVRRIRFGGSLRPSALSADMRYLLQQIDGLNGFQVADLGLGSVIATVEHTTPLGGIRLPFLDHVGRLGIGGLKRFMASQSGPISARYGPCVRTMSRSMSWRARIFARSPRYDCRPKAIGSLLRRIRAMPSLPCPKLAVWR
jgi:hypothetical protein